MHHRASLRERTHALYASLVADGGKVVLALVNGFGIPDHLLQVRALMR